MYGIFQVPETQDAACHVMLSPQDAQKSEKALVETSSPFR